MSRDSLTHEVRSAIFRAQMWLEYAVDVDPDYCKRATGLDVVEAVAVAHGLLAGLVGEPDAWAIEQDARHAATVAIENAQYAARTRGLQ